MFSVALNFGDYETPHENMAAEETSNQVLQQVTHYFFFLN